MVTKKVFSNLKDINLFTLLLQMLDHAAKNKYILAMLDAGHVFL